MNFSINASDRILIIAAHPEDLAVGCGGFISKYFPQIDILGIIQSDNQDIIQIQQVMQDMRKDIIQLFKTSTNTQKEYLITQTRILVILHFHHQETLFIVSV